MADVLSILEAQRRRAYTSGNLSEKALHIQEAYVYKRGIVTARRGKEQVDLDYKMYQPITSGLRLEDTIVLSVGNAGLVLNDKVITIVFFDYSHLEISHISFDDDTAVEIALLQEILSSCVSILRSRGLLELCGLEPYEEGDDYNEPLEGEDDEEDEEED